MDKTETESGQSESSGAGKRAIFAWCFFDWANSAFPTVIITFVFAAYVTKVVAGDVELGTARWGTAVSISALLVAVLAPILGAIADRGGRRKPWIVLFTALCIAAGAALWGVGPDPVYLLLALVLVGLANAAFELGQVFYNAMLPDVAPHNMLGRVSGWAWACGYFGAIFCLGTVLVLFALPEQPILGLDKETYEHVRISGPFVAVWFALFAWPMLLLTPDRPSARLPIITAAREGLKQLWGTFVQLRRYRNIAVFLLARMLYIDGLNTLFAFGGIYAAGTFGMDFQEILIFGVLLNVTAGVGAALFAWIDDLIGSKRTVMIAVAALTVLGAVILLVDSKLWFYVVGSALGVFIGPAQAASRTLMARLAPREMTTEMFGLFALSGKATAFVGPALVGWVTFWADSQRVGMATILVFFLAGLLLMLPVKEPRR
ncbi:MAG: MFS transporter [Kiloniellales bacterium]|nr:MFS transporter [Kiloniellales bacterium]